MPEALILASVAVLVIGATVGLMAVVSPEAAKPQKITVKLIADISRFAAALDTVSAAFAASSAQMLGFQYALERAVEEELAIAQIACLTRSTSMSGIRVELDRRQQFFADSGSISDARKAALDSVLMDAQIGRLG